MAMPDQPDTRVQDTDERHIELQRTNPLLSEDIPVDNIRAVLTLLTYIDLSDICLGDEGSYGLFLVHEWLRCSVTYSGRKNI
ncbi:MAG: hypothetical protein L3J98_02110 [Gammaproteobacteria bacterium]|nr:hypothetical protein [Gammaproteobacteria bacterium]